ncbi:MAG: cobalamin-binding protein [Nitrosopumilus sp.]|nr:cobalamin-binding protein [Nitrosopumilus sp.]
MTIKKIVSFLPSATELIYELETQELLYGVTHDCKYPKEAQDKPQVVNSIIDSEKLSSNEINTQTCQLLNEGKEIFVLNEETLKEANPDLIITQKTCEVCAVFTNQVEKAIHVLPKKPIVYSMDPHNLKEILISIIEIGELLEKSKKAEKIRIGLEKRILHVKKNLFKEKPRVLAIEWIEPFFTAGHWIPEMIEFAGGINLISKKGEHSRKIDIQEISKSDPEIIILMPCGFNSKRTITEYSSILKDNPDWSNLRAVKNKKIFAVDANSFFSKPSIRTITGLEILAKIIQPEFFVNVSIPNGSCYYVMEFTEV